MSGLGLEQRSVFQPGAMYDNPRADFFHNAATVLQNYAQGSHERHKLREAATGVADYFQQHHLRSATGFSARETRVYRSAFKAIGTPTPDLEIGIRTFVTQLSEVADRADPQQTQRCAVLLEAIAAAHRAEAPRLERRPSKSEPEKKY